MYDRERSLDSYREPSTNFGNASTGGAALGGAMLGDNTNLGNRGGYESGGLGNTGGNTGSAGYASTGRNTPGSSSYSNDLGTSSSDPSDLTTNE